MLKFGCYHILTLFPNSISLTSCSCPSLHSCVSCSCVHCLAVFLLTLPISPTNALLPDSIYKTPLHVIIWHVRIATLVFILIVYSTSLLTSELLNLRFQNSGNKPVNSRSTLALFLTTMLTSLDYAQFWIDFQIPGQLPILAVNLRTSSTHLKYSDMSSG